MLTRRTLAGALLTPALIRSAMAETEDTLTRIRRTKVLRIGAVPGQPPYSYKDLATGVWHGFLVDIATDLAAELGAAIEPVESNGAAGCWISRPTRWTSSSAWRRRRCGRRPWISRIRCIRTPSR